ncbi:MAG: ACT domain-containing protein [Desulforhopalus sp.]|jgi:glycine cleavage system regulatory protein|nr:ACT domain-containing protein [Desulforhopalus sp.]
MRRNFVTTVYGPDFPGIIKAMAQATRSHGGEWLTSKVIKLDGQFAALMNVVVEAELEDGLKSALEKKFPTLHFVYSQPGSLFREGTKVISLLVDCIDRPGLTGDLSTILANLDIRVESLEAKRYAMDGIGDTVYSAKLTLIVPMAAQSEAIAGEIEALSEDVRVTVR